MNSLDDSSATRPKLNKPQQHSASSSFRSAKTLSPYTSHQYTPSHFSQGNEEKLDALSTWRIDTDMYNDPSLALFETHDFACTEYSLPKSEHICNYHNTDDGVSEYGAMNISQEQIHSDDAVIGHNPSLLFERAGSCSRKLKMHEWPPQSDPDLEKRRRRAKRQREHRQKEREEVMRMKNQLADVNTEVTQLIPEANRLQQRIQMLQQYAAQCGCLSADLAFPRAKVS